MVRPPMQSPSRASVSMHHADAPAIGLKTNAVAPIVEPPHLPPPHAPLLEGHPKPPHLNQEHTAPPTVHQMLTPKADINLLNASVISAPKPQMPLVPHPMAAVPAEVATVMKSSMPLSAKKPEKGAPKALAVQASKGDPATPAEAPGGTKSSSASGGGGGGKEGDVNLLANEVWSILKRRLAFEAQRAGGR